MKMRMGLVVGLALAAASPVWAHCGSCGVGDEKSKGHGKDHHHAEKDHQRAEVGAPAPDFALQSTDGKTHKLSDYKGKVVVLEWTNHQCPVVNRCHKAKLTAGTLAKFKDKPVVWLAIDSSHFAAEKMAEIKSWASKNEVSYPILVDTGGKVGQAYAAKTTPHMFVIDAKGVLAYSGALDNDAYGDKAEGVRNFVEEAVTALLNDSTVARTTTKPYGCSVKYKPS